MVSDVKREEISPDIKSPKSLQQPKVVNHIGDLVNVPIKPLRKRKVKSR